MEDDSVSRYEFYSKMQKLYEGKHSNHTLLTRSKYEEIIHMLRHYQTAAPKPHRYYQIKRRFEIYNDNGTEKLVEPIKHKKGVPVIRFHVYAEQIFDILKDAHESTGHGGRQRMLDLLSSRRYCSITREQVMLYLSLCHNCVEKKRRSTGTPKLPSAEVVLREYLHRAAVDIIDLHLKPDGDFKYVLYFRDLHTRFAILRPLRAKTVNSIAEELIDIFALIGAPVVLQTDDSTLDLGQILTRITTLWPGLKILPATPKPNGPNNSGSAQEVEKILMAWCGAKHTKNWSREVKFVQHHLNTSEHSELKQSPFTTLFACQPKFGLISSILPEAQHEGIETEADFENALKNLVAGGDLLAESQENDQRMSINVGFSSNIVIHEDNNNPIDQQQSQSHLNQTFTNSQSIPIQSNSCKWEIDDTQSNHLHQV